MGINKLRTILAISFSSIVLISAGLGFTNILRQNHDQPSYSSWMADIDDLTPIRNINIPGSHNTMALYSVADLIGECQSLSLNDQLNLGVRFLDIRLKEESNKLKVVHDITDQRESFSHVTKTVESFLNKNPSEFIIMSVQEDVGPSNSTISFEESLLTYLDSDIYLKGNDIPLNLGSVRGKVMLFSRYKNSTIGVNASNGWRNSTSFSLPNDIYIQDKYEVSTIEEKQNEIINCFNETGHVLKINFLSAYHAGAFPPTYAPSVAKYINPWIHKEISKYDDRGIVLYDFITKSLMDSFFKR